VGVHFLYPGRFIQTQKTMPAGGQHHQHTQPKRRTQAHPQGCDEGVDDGDEGRQIHGGFLSVQRGRIAVLLSAHRDQKAGFTIGWDFKTRVSGAKKIVFVRFAAKLTILTKLSLIS
jgi:hypothetical protein